LGQNSKDGKGAKLVGLNAFSSIEYRLERSRIRIGSGAGNDLVLEHKSVSAKHALIRKSFGRYFIKDLGSTNGTFVNEHRIDGATAIRGSDELRLGAVRFVVVGGVIRDSKSTKYVNAVVAMLILIGIGYLSFDFVTNWENLEKLASTSVPIATARFASNATPLARATTASNEPFEPIPSVAEPRATPAGEVPSWLRTLNEYRVAVNLPPVVEDPKLSDADRKHATYIVKNYADRVSAGHLIGAELHEEVKGNPWYTPEGHDAGAHSDVDQYWGRATPSSPSWALDDWMVGPFHRLWILNPGLHRVGYGETCDKKYCIAALDLGDGADPIHGAIPLASPIEFPPDSSTTAFASFAAEWPTPLTACPGYAFPAGTPVTIQLGIMVEANLADYSITREGHAVEACGIDATTYQNPVASEQERGRAILRESGAAIIIPRYPLRPGAPYAVNAMLNNRSYQWSFIVTGSR